MSNLTRKIEDTAIKVDQVKSLMGVLLDHCDTMSKSNQDSIINIAFDILSEQKIVLLGISDTLSRNDKGR